MSDIRLNPKNISFTVTDSNGFATFVLSFPRTVEDVDKARRLIDVMFDILESEKAAPTAPDQREASKEAET